MLSPRRTPAMRFALALIILIGTAPWASAAVIFDSFTPPDTAGGLSSANFGIVTRISVAEETRISRISILNQMADRPGELAFVIFGGTDYERKLLTAPTRFPRETAASWKMSPPLDFVLLAGNEYLVGYVRNVDVIDLADQIAESEHGITSLLGVSCINGFDDPVFSHNCLGGMDAGFRLHDDAVESVPLPHAALPLLVLGVLLVVRRRGVARHPRTDRF